MASTGEKEQNDQQEGHDEDDDVAASKDGGQEFHVSGFLVYLIYLKNRISLLNCEY